MSCAFVANSNSDCNNCNKFPARSQTALYYDQAERVVRFYALRRSVSEHCDCFYVNNNKISITAVDESWKQKNYNATGWIFFLSFVSSFSQLHNDIQLPFQKPSFSLHLSISLSFCKQESSPTAAAHYFHYERAEKYKFMVEWLLKPAEIIFMRSFNWIDKVFLFISFCAGHSAVLFKLKNIISFLFTFLPHIWMQKALALSLFVCRINIINYKFASRMQFFFFSISYPYYLLLYFVIGLLIWKIQM